MNKKRLSSEHILLSLTYIIGRILIYGLIVLFVLLAYSVGRDYMGISVIIKDGLNRRAAAIIKNEESGDILQKAFTQTFLENDALLSSDIYSGEDYLIRDFIYFSSTDFIIIFPWQNNVTVIATERIPYINGEYRRERIPENAPDDFDTAPPQWQDGRYKITLIRNDNVWKITKMELIEPLEKVMPAVASPSPSPSQTSVPSPSPNE